MRLPWLLGGMTCAAVILAPQLASAHPGHPELLDLLHHQTLTPGLVAAGLGAAFVFGAGHALSPGHGKTMVAAYLVGSRSTPGHALLLGVTTTLTHTFSVYVLGVVALLLSRYILPETLYSILGVASGLMVCGVGYWLLRQRLGDRTHHHHHYSDGHGHEHSHDHSFHGLHSHDSHSHDSHSHDSHSHDSHSHGLHSHDSHSHDSHSHGLHSHDGHSHDGHSHDGHSHRLHSHGLHSHGLHSHDSHSHHDHDHRDHGHQRHGYHSHDHANLKAHPVHPHHHRGHSHYPRQESSLGYEHPVHQPDRHPYHSHGHHHHHLDPDRPITLRSLLTLGISGGIVPCPSALVLLLSAIALHQTVYGMALISSFSLGLATVLVAIGLIAVYTRQGLDRFSLPQVGFLRQHLPIFSASFVLWVGIALTITALV